MKNRLIYILITSMVFALIGIIVLQSIWISHAIEEREKLFSTHVNDALNAINDAIDEDEATFFIKEEFGGVDSLLHDVMIHQKKGDSLRRENIMFFKNEITATPEEMHKNHRKMIKEHRKMMTTLPKNMAHKLEIKMEAVDSILEANDVIGERKERRMHHISSVVKHYTFEQMLSGKLEDRITEKGLKEKLEKTFKKEGLSPQVEFAVYNNDTKSYEEGFMSHNFQKKFAGKEFRKNLFPGDRIKQSKYDLIIQPLDQGVYIWRGVTQMLLLSVAFTILILLCFGYSLYFIFKQKKISQIKNDFINNMTHELKTPLASISLAASSIKHPEVIKHPEEIENFVAIIESEKERMNAHIEKVLDMAALDKGELKMNQEEIDLIKIIEKSLKNVNLSLTESAGTIVFNHKMETAPLKGDEFHLINVFTNVLDNSIKYRRQKLSIVIDLVQEVNMYTVTIVDNGIGMSAKTQKLAFDRFYRAETGNIHNIKGFGLGLSYAKSIVEAHLGMMSIHSELNKGTTLTIKIPKNHE